MAPIRPARALLPAVVGVVLCLAACASSGASTKASHDRAGLRGNIDHHLAAMVAYDPGRLKLAAQARFREDTVEKKL